MNSEDGLVYSVCILQFSCFTKYNRMQSKHKQTKYEHSRRTLADFSFLRRYHYTKSKNFLKRGYWIRHWIPMFIGTPCRFSLQGFTLIWFLYKVCLQCIVYKISSTMFYLLCFICWVSFTWFPLQGFFCKVFYTKFLQLCCIY